MASPYGGLAYGFGLGNMIGSSIPDPAELEQARVILAKEQLDNQLRSTNARQHASVGQRILLEEADRGVRDIPFIPKDSHDEVRPRPLLTEAIINNKLALNPTVQASTAQALNDSRRLASQLGGSGASNFRFDDGRLHWDTPREKSWYEDLNPFSEDQVDPRDMSAMEAYSKLNDLSAGYSTSVPVERGLRNTKLSSLRDAASPEIADLYQTFSQTPAQIAYDSTGVAADVTDINLIKENRVPSQNLFTYINARAGGIEEANKARIAAGSGTSSSRKNPALQAFEKATTDFSKAFSEADGDPTKLRNLRASITSKIDGVVKFGWDVVQSQRADDDPNLHSNVQSILEQLLALQKNVVQDNVQKKMQMGPLELKDKWTTGWGLGGLPGALNQVFGGGNFVVNVEDLEWDGQYLVSKRGGDPINITEIDPNIAREIVRLVPPPIDNQFFTPNPRNTTNLMEALGNPSLWRKTHSESRNTNVRGTGRKMITGKGTWIKPKGTSIHKQRERKLENYLQKYEADPVIERIKPAIDKIRNEGGSDFTVKRKVDTTLTGFFAKNNIDLDKQKEIRNIIHGLIRTTHTSN